MCGRFNIIDDPSLRELLRTLGVDLAVGHPDLLATRVNVAPTADVPIVVGAAQHRELHSMRWWLTPAWSDGPSTRYSMFNARSESIARSRAFRGPLLRQRGVVPVSSFIEWSQGPDGRQAWLIAPEQGALALAAIWDTWQRGDEVVRSCCLVTTAAVPAFEPWHHRMPVMLRAEDVDSWLEPQPIEGDLERYFAPRLPTALSIAPLGKAVNNARNNAPELLQPLAPPEVIYPC